MRKVSGFFTAALLTCALVTGSCANVFAAVSNQGVYNSTNTICATIEEKQVPSSVSGSTHHIYGKGAKVPASSGVWIDARITWWLNIRGQDIESAEYSLKGAQQVGEQNEDQEVTASVSAYSFYRGARCYTYAGSSKTVMSFRIYASTY